VKINSIASSTVIAASCSFHHDPLVRRPTPDAAGGGIVNAPDAHMNVLARMRRIRSADDVVLAGLVDEAIAELQLHGRTRCSAEVACAGFVSSRFFAGSGLRIHLLALQQECRCAILPGLTFCSDVQPLK
jgi:hypothetical protein